MQKDIFFRVDDFVFSFRVGGLLVRDNKVLLQKHREKEEFYIIGGHITSLETAKDALKREFKEELGADIGIRRKIRTIRLALSMAAIMFLLVLAACGQQRDLVEMESIILANGRGIVWEDRTYELFCVISKKDCGKQIGYVDGDTDDKVSEYKGHAVEEWLINWIPTDGGAMLLKEQGVVDIPEGLEREY